MSNTTTVSPAFAETVLRRLDRLEKALVRLAKTLEGGKEPRAGSKEWWDYATQKGLQEIRDGKGILLRNGKEIDAFFDSL